MTLLQQTPNCSDFDVILEGETSPAFRVLLPERIWADGLDSTQHFHTVPGTCRRHAHGIEGSYAVGNELEIAISIETRPHDIGVVLKVRNIGRHALADVWADVCAGLSRLPGQPAWCNRQFLPNVPLDRALQGRHWYEQLTPRRLLALTDEGWVPMHPSPERPQTNSVPAYSSVLSEMANARACALQSPDGGVFFFQAWASPCRYRQPFPGNACMHLEPFVSANVEPSSSASIRGLVGMHYGDQRSLVERIERFRAAAD